jgi:DNA-binding NarL/FixJ family response regulator
LQSKCNSSWHPVHAGKASRSRLSDRGGASDWRSAAHGLRNDREPGPIRRIALVDTHGLSVDCLRRLLEEHDPSVSVSVYNNLLGWLRTAKAEPDVIVLNIHSALVATEDAVHEVERIVEVFPQSLLVTLADFDEAQWRTAFLRLFVAGSDRVLSSHNTTPQDVLLAIGLRVRTMSAAAGTMQRVDSFSQALQGKRTWFGRMHPAGL